MGGTDLSSATLADHFAGRRAARRARVAGHSVALSHWVAPSPNGKAARKYPSLHHAIIQLLALFAQYGLECAWA